MLVHMFANVMLVLKEMAKRALTSMNVLRKLIIVKQDLDVKILLVDLPVEI